MPYDLELAERVKLVLAGKRNLVIKKLFGGQGFMLRGHLCVAIWDYSLVVRVGAEDYLDALAEPFTEEFDVTGRPLTGWIVVNPEGIDSAANLRRWVERGVNFVQSLPKKETPPAKRRKKT